MMTDEFRQQKAMRPKKVKIKPRKKSKARIASIERRKKLKDWSAEVRTRDGYRCVVCEEDKNIQAHHLLEKNSYRHLQFDIMVGICLCAGCHSFRRLSFHHNPFWAVEWLKTHRPEQYAWVMVHIDDGAPKVEQVRVKVDGLEEARDELINPLRP